MWTVAILIPTYNRSEHLRKTLAAIGVIDREYVTAKIVVADNNSTDSTKRVVREADVGMQVEYIFEPRQGKGYAMRAAVEAAEAEWLLFTDDDVTPEYDWLESYRGATMRWRENVLFGGPVHSPAPIGVDPAVAKAAEWVGLNVFHSISEGPMPVNRWPAGANFLIRSETISEEGVEVATKFGPSGRMRIAGYETSIFRQLERYGHRAIYVPNAGVVHRTGCEFWEVGHLSKRAYSMGRGSVRLGQTANKAGCLCGVPRYVLRTWGKRYVMEQLWRICGNREKQMDARFRRMFCAGQIREYLDGSGKDGL